MDKMYPFKDCNMELIEAIPTNSKPDYSIKLLERIEQDFNIALEMAKKKAFTYKYPNHYRLMRIVWKLGFNNTHEFQALLNRKRKEQNVQKEQDIERKRLGIDENIQISKLKQKGEWLYQELKF